MTGRRLVLGLVLAASIWVAGVAPAAAQSTADQADIERALSQLRSPDRVDQALGAIAAQHVIKRQWRFNLLGRTELRWWQQALQPGVFRLIEMLGDDAGLEWIEQNGMTEQITTPRKEAALTLVGLERAAIGPLVAALARPELARKSDEVLRRITGDRGPGERTQAAWQAWWQAREGAPLPRERGQLPRALLILVLLGGAVYGVFFLQRKLGDRRVRPGLSLRTPSEPAPGEAGPSAPADPSARRA